MRASSNRPWMVPSSPFLPCMTGAQMSMWTSSAVPSFSSQMPWSVRSGLRTQGMQSAPFSQLPSAMASGVGLQASQRPCLVMPTGNTSYRSAQGACARARSQVEAETQLTSCSLDTPPKNNATRSFLVSFIVERLLNSYIQTHYKSSAYYNTILCRGLP